MVRGPDDQCSGASGAQDEYRSSDGERLADLSAAGQDRSSGSACVLAVGAFCEQKVEKTFLPEVVMNPGLNRRTVDKFEVA